MSQVQTEIRAVMRTAVGVVRDHNEDAAYIDPELGLYVVADGMGGQCAGEIASAMAIAAVRAVVEPARSALATARAGRMTRKVRKWANGLVERAIWEANRLVLEQAEGDPDRAGMGTTLDVALIIGDEAFVGHVGDGRIYLVRDGIAWQATIDHTVAQAMCEQGLISEQEALQSPLRCALTNAVGSTPGIQIDQSQLALRPGDRLLLCTDGLYDYFSEVELAGHLGESEGDDALTWLMGEACSRGGTDNLTGVVIAVEPAVDAFEDEPTEPFELQVPAGGPLTDVADDTLATFVELNLRESSGPHRYPRALSPHD